MMKRIAVALLFVAGCASNLPSPNYDDLIGTAYATMEAVASTTEILCAAETSGGPCTGELSTADRNTVRDNLDDAVVLLREANALNDKGDGAAVTRVQQAISIIRIAINLLEARA